MSKVAVIVGGGPAGLTAAFELLRRTDLRPVVLEADPQVGGISRTVVHAGNRLDIGGHRFFSREARVMDWWLDRLPVQAVDGPVELAYHGRRAHLASGEGPDPQVQDQVMLLRPRRSRILHRGHLFPYPLRLDPPTLRKLGAVPAARIAASYARASLLPRPERNLEDFLVNRFGQELYRTFFQSYTEKVWGRPCREISAEWGAQRIKGLSLRAAVADYLQRVIPGARSPGDPVETSLIERFLYPKLGPGQMWETVAREVVAAGGEVRLGQRAVAVLADPAAPRRVRGVRVQDRDGHAYELEAAHVFSTMPVAELVAGLRDSSSVPADVAEVAAGLCYRDFVTVGLLLDRLALQDRGRPLDDNWIYLQDPRARAGRMQIFNNWSPWLVADPATTWVGLEYFCDRGDALWSTPDAALVDQAAAELVALGLARPGAVRDGVVVRMPRTYPAYFGTWDRFDGLRAWLDGFENLWLVGRNGMHRYNNQDHSVLTAMVAVDQIAAGRVDKAPVWAVNTEPDYHEGR
ncbi:NAD(P)/FAD-dependent oxidoreductase [Myxococcota bacterium]|nr:NAD(P)/FAD-dependent oxidoreductase [Myxococcota bacterium]